MKDKLLLIFNEPAGIPHIGSVQLGDADIHSNLTNYIEKIYNYEGILTELSNSEALNGTTPVLNILTRMTRTRTHTNDFYKETFSLGTQALFFNAGVYTDPTPVKSKKLSWEMGVMLLESKIMNTEEMEIDKLRRNGLSVLPKFVEAMDRVIMTYTSVIYPALFYKSIFNVANNGGAYNKSFGLLRNTQVDSLMLASVDSTAVAGSQKSAIRNHYRAIRKPSTVAGQIGITPQDIDDVKRYLGNYKENANKQIVAVTSSNVINTLAGFYQYLPTKDYFLENGIPSTKIAGIHFVEADYIIPEDFILFVVYDPIVERGHLLTKVINPRPEYQGMYVTIGDKAYTWDDFDEAKLSEAKLKIGDIDVHLTGRTRALWLDCGNRVNTDGLMTQGGLDILTRQYADYLATFNGLIKAE